MEDYLTLKTYFQFIKEALNLASKSEQELTLYRSKDDEGNYFYKVSSAGSLEVRYVDKSEFDYYGTESLYCLEELNDMYNEEFDEDDEDRLTFKKWLKENYVKVLLM